MKCCECGSEVREYEAVLVNEDGDFACSQQHKEQYLGKLYE